MEVASVGEDGGALIWRGEVRGSLVLFVAASLLLHLEARETLARPLCVVVAGGLCLHLDAYTHILYVYIYVRLFVCI